MPLAQKREPSLRRCQRSSPARPAPAPCAFRPGDLCGAIGFAEDARHVAADGFLRRPAQQPLRTAVPAGDAALQVGGENGVILGAVDDLPAAFLLAAQSAELQQGHDLARHRQQLSALARREFAGLVVKDAQGAQWQAVTAAQDHRGVETGGLAVFQPRQFELGEGVGMGRTRAPS